MKEQHTRNTEIGLFTESQAATYLGFSSRALQTWRNNKKGPPFVRFNGGSIRYRKQDLDMWVADLEQTMKKQTRG